MDNIIESLEMELGLRKQVVMKPKPGPNNGLRPGYTKKSGIPKHFTMVSVAQVPPSIKNQKTSNRQIKTKTGDVFIVKKWGATGKRYYKKHTRY